MFLVVIPFAVAAIICMRRFRGEIRLDEGGSINLKDALLYGIAIVLCMGGVINLPTIWALVCMIVGLAFLFPFVKVELRVPYHILNVRLFRNRVFSRSFFAIFMNYALFYSISFFVELYLQSIGNLTSVEAGLLILVQPACRPSHSVIRE